MNYIDLFAGAGGLSEGFIRNGFFPIAHVEMDENACKTLKTRVAYHNVSSNIYESYIRGNITSDELWGKIPENHRESVIQAEISSSNIDSLIARIDHLKGSRKVDVIIGGPPCQAYSLVGRSRDPNGMKGDKRNFLFRYYARFLSHYKPKYFVFENVLGLLTAGNSRYLNEMVQLFDELGYSVSQPTVLNSEDYDVLQKRRRVIIIGQRGKKKFQFPLLETTNFSWQIQRDLFSDLPILNHGQELNLASYRAPINSYLDYSKIRNGKNLVTQHITRKHNDRDLEIYSIAIHKWINNRERLKYNDLPHRLQSHNNTESFLDRYKVVDPFGCSHTVVAHIAKDGHYYIYPDLNNPRSISVREAARIQSFPDNYYFEGGRTAAFKQIGNAVPPLMAYSLAKTIATII